MPSVLMNFVIAFAELFSKPVFARVKILLTGAILSPVSRTVTNALRVMGLSQEKHFENYHRVLNRDQWSSLKGSQILLNLLVKTFGLFGELVIGFDDTIERRWGGGNQSPWDLSGCGAFEQIIFCQVRSARIALALVYALDRSSVCQKGLGFTIFDGFVSFGKI